MKSKFALLLLGGLFAWLILTSTSTGYNRNDTGATGSKGCSCHGNTSSINPIVELDSAGVAVLSYVAGMSYTVKLSGTQVSGKAYFGYELSLVKAAGAGSSSAAQAGTWGTLPSGNKSSTSRVMIEQSTRLSASSNMYSISIPWTAPVAGTGSVRIYGILNAVNGDGNTSGDGAQNASNNGLTITESTGGCPTASISASGDTLKAVATGATAYQWYNGATAIAGATSATYMPTASGSYTVAVTAGSCNITSPAYVYTAHSTGINDLSLQHNIHVYPTLASDIVNIRSSEISDLRYAIYDLNGQWHIGGELTANAVNRIDITGLASSVYIIRVANDNSAATYKIIKQ